MIIIIVIIIIMCLFKPLAVKLLNYRFCQQGTHNIHNTHDNDNK